MANKCPWYSCKNGKPRCRYYEEECNLKSFNKGFSPQYCERCIRTHNNTYPKKMERVDFTKEDYDVVDKFGNEL